MLGCTASAELIEPKSSPASHDSGLRMVGHTNIPNDFTGTPHATRLLLGQSTTSYILDTNVAFAYERSGPEWELGISLQQEPFMRCTVGDYDPVTSSLY